MSLAFLNTNTLDEVTFGKTRLEKTKEGYVFHRLTEKQEKALSGNPKYFSEKCYSDYFYRFGLTCANITVDFITNSKRFVVDIAGFDGVNGYENNILELFVNDTKIKEISAKGRYSFDLPDESHIKMLFPYYGKVVLNGIGLEMNSYCKPWEHSKKWLVYGDSIMHGEMATSPSLSCVSRVVEKYNVEVLNESCAGYVCDCEMIDSSFAVKPDIVTFGYGINDYRNKSFEENKRDLCECCKKLKSEFASSKIYLLSPVYSKILCVDKPEDGIKVNKMFREVADCFDIFLIDGLSMIPHRSEYFMPDGIHPNDHGFLCYADSLGKIIFG